MGLGIWTWVLVQERFGRGFTDARGEPEFVEELGKERGKGPEFASGNPSWHRVQGCRFSRPSIVHIPRTQRCGNPKERVVVVVLSARPKPTGKDAISDLDFLGAVAEKLRNQ
jgi:hypothetical protein